jgi:hypothetical protein
MSLLKLLLTLTILAALATAQPLKQPCPSPHFPGDATPIDDQCGASGSAADTTPEGLQNNKKNDFCAQGDATTVTAAILKTLQKSTETAERHEHATPGSPPAARDFLTTLGEGDLVTFEGFVFLARQECKETVNCGLVPPNTDASHDIHISLLDQPRKTTKTATPAKLNREECTSIVAEMIPHHRPAEWTACNLNDIAAKGLRVRVTGQRFFDGSHVPCIGSTPQGSNPKRASLWELHPIYTFDVCPTGDCADGGWVPLSTFAEGKTTCVNKPCAVAAKKKPVPRPKAHAKA